MFLFHLRGLALGAWQTHGHVLAETKGPVIPSVERDRLDREVRPVRKLHGEQPAHKSYADVYFVRGHFSSQHALGDVKVAANFFEGQQRDREHFIEAVRLDQLELGADDFR